MASKKTNSNVFNFIHSPADIAEDTVLDGVRMLTSREIEVPGKFSSLVFSINAQIPADSCVLAQVQVRTGDKWSGYYKLGMFSPRLKTSFPPQKDSFGQVNTDELSLAVAAQAYRFRLQISGHAKVFLVAVCGVKDPFIYDEKTAARLPRNSVFYPLEPISQMEQKTVHRRRICSPTALCMALNRLEQKISLPDVMEGVYDQAADIYGNWLFNTAYAGEYPALAAYVRRFASLEELKDFATDDSCVLASIAFEENELPGAPLAHTAGHFVVIQGWKDNQIFVADPASPTAGTVCRAYGREEFARAWLKRKQGVSYIVRKK